MHLNRPTILFGMQHRLHRETFAAAVRELRPDLDIVAVTQGEIGASLRNYHPCLLICSRLNTAIQDSGVPWVMIPSSGDQPVESNLGGEHCTHSPFALADLITLIDRAVTSAGPTSR